MAVLHGLFALFLTLLPQTGDVALRQIVFATEEQAKAARTRVIAGASFEDLAVELSRDTTAQHGGYMGRMRLSELRIEVQKAIEAVPPGGISDPVRLGNTYVLFQVVPEAESHWIDLDEAGAQALAAGRRTEAMAHLEQALAQAEASKLGDARLARSLDSLAAVYRLEDRVVDAEKMYRRALAVLERMAAPELEIAQVLSGLGTTLVQEMRFGEAESLYARARSIRETRLGPDHPDVAATLHNIAELFAAQGRFAEAAKIFDQSQALLERKLGANHPATVAAAQSLQTFRRLVMLELLERSSTAAGLAEFQDPEFMVGIRELLPLAPPIEDVYVQVKDILFKAGLGDETEEVLQTGLKKFPASRLLRIHLADVLAGIGRTLDSLAVLQEASRLQTPAGLDEVTERQQQAVLYLRIGDMQSALTNLDGAIASYRRAVELDPASAGVQIKLGKAYFSAGRLGEAQAEFERAIRQTPDSGEAQLSLSEAQLAGGKWEPAVTAAERAIELNVSDSRVLYVLGTALVRMGQREEGQKRLEEFARVEAGFLEAEQRNREITSIRTTAAAALREGDGNSAIEQLTRGIKRYPDDGSLQMGVAVVQMRMGRHAMAIETLESMITRGTGRGFLVHKNLAAEYDVVGNVDNGRRHRKVYLDTRETELLQEVSK